MKNFVIIVRGAGTLMEFGRTQEAHALTDEFKGKLFKWLKENDYTGNDVLIVGSVEMVPAITIACTDEVAERLKALSEVELLYLDSKQYGEKNGDE